MTVVSYLGREKTCPRNILNGPTQTSLCQKRAIYLKFRIKEVEGLYYLCSENKGADQLICFTVPSSTSGSAVVHMNRTVRFQCIKQYVQTLRLVHFIDLGLQDMPRLQKSDRDIPAGNNYASSFAADSNVNSVILDPS